MFLYCYLMIQYLFINIKWRLYLQKFKTALQSYLEKVEEDKHLFFRVTHFCFFSNQFSKVISRKQRKMNICFFVLHIFIFYHSSVWNCRKFCNTLDQPSNKHVMEQKSIALQLLKCYRFVNQQLYAWNTFQVE